MHIHRLAALEVAAEKLEQQQRQPALALADAVAALEGRLEEVQGKVEEMARARAREREAAEVGGCGLKGWRNG